MPLRRAASSVAVVLAFAGSVVACSSESEAPPLRDPDGLNGGRPSEDGVREQLARAAIHAHADDAYAERVKTWSRALPSGAICAAAKAIDTGDRRLAFSVGATVMGTRREIVFDLSTARAAVYTKSAAGGLVDARTHTYLTSAGAADVALPDDGNGGATGLVRDDVARSVRTFIGIDGSTYGVDYALSTAATRAWLRATPSAAGKVEGVRVSFEAVPSERLDAGGATAAAIFAWSGDRDPRAIEAAVLAIVANELASKGAHDASALCNAQPASASVKTKIAPRDLGGGGGGDGFDFDTSDWNAWLEAAPSSPATEVAPVFEAASCATEPSLACTGSQLCNQVGESYCCTDEQPAAKPCGGSYASCDEGESCIVAASSPDANGNMMTCAPSSGAMCNAAPVLLAPSQNEVAEEVKKSVDSCFDEVDYNKLGYSYADAGETYTHRSGSTVWSVGSYLGSAASWLVNKGDQGRAWIESISFGSTPANQYLGELEDRMKQKFAAGGWENYQKVCLAQCIASQIIRYQENMLSKFGGASAAVAQGVGVCTEFSAIAKRLIEDTSGGSVETWIGMSPGHAFVQVKFDGNTYSIEPQHNPKTAGTCRFYR